MYGQHEKKQAPREEVRCRLHLSTLGGGAADAEPDDIDEVLKSSAIILAAVRVQAGAII